MSHFNSLDLCDKISTGEELCIALQELCNIYGEYTPAYITKALQDCITQVQKDTKAFALANQPNDIHDYSEAEEIAYSYAFASAR